MTNPIHTQNAGANPVTTEPAPNENHPQSNRFSRALTFVVEDLISHILELSSEGELCNDSVMSREEAEAIAAEFITNRCFGMKREDDFQLMIQASQGLPHVESTEVKDGTQS